jgi:hypothetical protein
MLATQWIRVARGGRDTRSATERHVTASLCRRRVTHDSLRELEKRIDLAVRALSKELILVSALDGICPEVTD